MFKVVASFTRENLDYEFFYHKFWEHETVKKIQQKFKESKGSVDLEILEETDYRIDIALVFDTKENFMKFAMENHSLIEERSKLIENWLNTTGHSYKYYMIE